jgi:transmembrane sensor
MPTPDKIREYAEKWLNGSISEAEKAIFEQWYNAPTPELLPLDEEGGEEELREEIFARIRRDTQEEGNILSRGRSRRAFILRLTSLAAACTVLVIGVWQWGAKTKTPVPGNVPDHSQAPGIAARAAGYTRQLTLPDGSTAVLHADSKLDSPLTFSGGTREVSLSGEAYFDIRHDGKRPFIIHTGAIRTTVLGTAFNIKAYPGSGKITISLVRGKLRVENNSRILAILTPDHQLTCDATAGEGRQDSVNASAVIADWTRQDMAFEDLSFESVVQVLHRRYGVSIGFRNPALQKCRIKAFFNGTESLEKVLDVLCIISNATWSQTDKEHILLDGKGCE